MPSRPLSADTKAVVKLSTRLDVEAIDVAKGRTEMPAAGHCCIEPQPVILTRDLPVRALPEGTWTVDRTSLAGPGGLSSAG